MKEIIKDITQLEQVSEPLKFLNLNGTMDTEEKKVCESIIQELKQTLEANSELVALAGPQIGYYKRIFCIKFNDTIKVFINPIITKKSNILISPETFASMPNKEILIARPEEVSAVYYNEDFKYEDNKLLGAAARIFDQMIQLLDGVTPAELGFISDVTTDGKLSDLSQEEFLEAVELYKQYITLKQKKLKEAIEKDSESQKYYDYLRATEAVINGRVQIVESEDETKQRVEAHKSAKKIQNITPIISAKTENLQRNLQRKLFVNKKRRSK